MQSISKWLKNRFLFCLILPLSLEAVPNEAYVTSTVTDSIYVINVEQGGNNVVSTIVPLTPAAVTQGIAVSPDSTRVYVLNASGYFFVLDAAATEVIGVINFGGDLYNVAVTPNGAEAYVTNDALDLVYAIDLATNLYVSIPVGSIPLGIDITPDGGAAYVINGAGNSSQRIDTGTKLITNTIPLAPMVFPHVIAISPLQPKAYVTDLVGTSLGILSTASNTLTGTIPLGFTSYDVAFSPNGSIAYVTEFHGNHVALIDTASDTVLSTFTLGTGTSELAGVAFNPNGTRAFFSENIPGTSSRLQIVITDSNLVDTAVPVTANGGLNFIAVSNELVGPFNAFGQTETTKFATQVQRVNLLRWDASSDRFVIGYRIYRNGVQIATVYAHREPYVFNGELLGILPPTEIPYEYVDRNRPKHARDVYTIVAFNEFGFTSAPVEVEFVENK